MAEFHQLDDTIFVTGQINDFDIQQVNEQGIKMVICNRPDGEEAGQVPAADFEALLKTHDIDFRYIPIIRGQLTRQNVITTKEAFDEAEGPILAYCRSGLRSTIMWAMVQAALDRMSNLQIINKANNVGYDLNPLLDALTGVRADDLSKG